MNLSINGKLNISNTICIITLKDIEDSLNLT